MSTNDARTADDAATELEPVSGATEFETESDAPVTDEPAESAVVAEPVNQKRGSKLGWLTPAILVVLLVASLAVAGWLYYFWYRADQQLGDNSQQAALNAAGDGVVAVLTYSPETLDKDFAKAKTYLTGDFLNYYTDYTQRIVTPAAKEKSVKTAAAVVRKSLIEIQPDTAQALLFINQSTTSKSMPDGSYSTSAVKVGLQKHNGAWLISSFDPV
jgi:Mce-associated membrane protein